MARVLVVGDLHCPFQNKRAFDFIDKIYSEWKCNTLILMGDEIDCHALSKHPIDPDGLSAGHEHEQAILQLQTLYDKFDEAMICTSNHTARPLRRAFEAGLPKAFIRSYEEFMRAPPGWRWADFWEIDGVRYVHGEGFNGQSAHTVAARSFRQSTVIGHVHSFAGINFLQGRDRIFGFNVGCLINPEMYAFNYAKHMANKPCIGLGVVIDGEQPHWIPMPDSLKST